MVGYQKDDNLTANQKLIAGCISGAMTRFITQPLDVIKLRTQLQKKHADRSENRIFMTTRKILAEEGITAFWHGHNLGQMHSVMSVTCQFYIYEMSTKYVVQNLNPEHRSILLFLCGIFAGCCSATLVIPLEVIRVRQMIVKAQYGGLLRGARMVYNSGGILAFYEGLGASLLQMGPAVGISFAVFRLIQPLVLSYLSPECQQPGKTCKHAVGNPHKPEYLLIASTVAGSASGFVSKTLTYPFDLTKRRLQIASHKDDARFQTAATKSRKLVKCTSLQACIANTVKKEGLPGLFRGWKVTVLKAQLTSVIAFTTYEMTHKEDPKYKTPSTSRELRKCTKLLECLSYTFRSEGLSGLYRGWNVTMVKAQITSVVLFTSYEAACYFFREVNNRKS